ncbi:hypothetical protein PSTG_18474, partial [Puccinia striiformis f. sp. tritici PST-78]
YLLADSANTASNIVVPAFKRPNGRSLPTNKQKFNFESSHQRVAIKHTISMLKNRWQSLKILSLHVNGAKSARRVNCWIRACAVLHNYLIEKNDVVWDELTHPWTSDEPDDEDNGLVSGKDPARRDLIFSRFCRRHGLVN